MRITFKLVLLLWLFSCILTVEFKGYNILLASNGGSGDFGDTIPGYFSLELSVNGLELKVNGDETSPKMYIDKLAFFENKGSFMFFDETQSTSRMLAKAEMTAFNAESAKTDMTNLEKLAASSDGVYRVEKGFAMIVSTQVLKLDGFKPDVISFSFSNIGDGTFSVRESNGKRVNAKTINFNVFEKQNFTLSTTDGVYYLKGGDLVYININRVGLKDLISNLFVFGWSFEQKDNYNGNEGAYSIMSLGKKQKQRRKLK
jgi:hypothetical protein